MNIKCCFTTIVKFQCNNLLNFRTYARWAHRKPIRIIASKEINSETNETQIQEKKISNLNNNVINTSDLIDRKPNTFIVSDTKPMLFNLDALDVKTHLIKEIKRKGEQKNTTKYVQEDIFSTTIDDTGEVVYTKMKDNDPKIGTLMLTVKSRKLQKRKDCILLEGKRLILDALQAGCKLQYLLFSRKSDIDSLKKNLPSKGVQLYKIAYRDMQIWSDLTSCPGIMAICKIPDFNCEKQLKNVSGPSLTVICDNIREPGNLGSILRAAVAAGASQIILSKGCVDLWEPKVLRSACGAHFHSPIYEKKTWEEIKKMLPPKNAVFIADNNHNKMIINSSGVENNDCATVPVIPYYSPKFNEYSAITLIIGGETKGLSGDCYELAANTKGARLNIPLNNEIESLNASTALGVIVFEMKRQLLQHDVKAKLKS